MNKGLFNEIRTTIRNHRGLSVQCASLLETKFPNVDLNTLYSILSIEYQRRMRCNHIKTPDVQNKYWERYNFAIKNREPPGIITRMSAEYDVTPCLIAKLILQKYFDVLEKKVDNINVYLRDTTLISDMDLAYEVFLCTMYDDLYSPQSEVMKQSIGQQYEIKLYKELENLGLAFRPEDHLRQYGYDKTPDVKLDVPIAVDGKVVNWIESKALFGDEITHREYMKNQYLSYWNRFGSGLVIYWFGYLETVHDSSDKRFIIKNHMPKDIIQMSIS